MEVLIKDKTGPSRLGTLDATYNGLFLRSQLNQANNLPRKGAQYYSPDIIPYGTQPIADPQKYLKDNYNSDLGKSLEAGYTNYIYMRAKNFSSNKISADTNGNRPRLFWTKAALLDYPSRWHEIKSTSSGSPVSMVANAGDIGVINEPFTWIPENINDDHYCVIGTVPSPGYDNNIPTSLQISDLAAWVAENGGVAWKNLTVVNSKNLTLNDQVDYYQGSEASEVFFTIDCKNVPLGSKVSFSSGTPGPVPALNLNKTEVTTEPNFSTGLKCDVPAEYSTNIQITVEAPPGVTDMRGAVVEMSATTPFSPGSRLFHLGHSLGELGIPTPEHAYGMIKRRMEKMGRVTKLTPGEEMYLDQLSGLYAKLGPTRVIVVGQNGWSYSG